MANATITGTASNFGSISGVLAGEAGTVAGTITGTVSGTLTGSVGVPGAGVPSGGTTGQVLKKVSNTDYDTTWGTDLASAAWGTITGTITDQTDLTAYVAAQLAGGTAVAKNLEVYVRNQSGATLTAGTIVYIDGATGNRPTVTKAQANNDANSAQTFGFIKENIANNGFGYVIVRGELENVDTSALTEGQQLYLSPTTAGTWTTTKPSAPQHLVYVGICIRAHPTQGVILVAIQNGYELNELHDVKITSVSNGQVLKYDSAQGLWVNGTDSSGVAWGGITGTLSAQTDLQTALDGKLSLTGGTVSDGSTVIFPSTAAGGTLTAGGSDLLKVVSSASASDFAQLTYSSLLLNDASGNQLYVLPTQINFPDSTVQSTAFIPADFLSKAGNLSGLADLATSRSNLGLGTMATATASDYSTTTVANGLYYPLSSNPAGYLTSAPVTSVAGKTGAVTLTNTDISGLGTMATATATDYLAKADNLSGLANTGTARTNLGLGTMATETAANYFTGSYIVTTYAPLASPALTGTPTAPTAAAATNTTQIATTAFVQTAAPDASTTTKGKVELATIAESLDGDSASLVPTVEDVQWMMMNNSFRPYFNVTGGTSGTGAATNPVPPFRYEVAGPNAAVAGSAYVQTNNYSGMSVGQGPTVFDFSKKCWVSFHLDNASATWVGDANNELKVFWGLNTSNNGDDPNGKAIGVWKQGGSSSLWNLMVHNGTTLTKVATSSTTMPTGQIQRFTVYSDGAGNVKLYINGTEVASTSSGPTGTRADTRFWCSVKQTASAATRILAVLWYPKVSSAP